MKAHDDLPVTPNYRPHGRWATWADEASKDPGVWYEVGIYHRTMVNHLRHGRIVGVDPDLFDFASRKTDEGKPNHARIFMRAKP